MIIVGLFGVALGSVNNQIAAELPIGSLLIAFISGCAVAGFACRARMKHGRTVQVPENTAKCEISPFEFHPTMPDNFPGSLVRLERNGSHWVFTLLSRGSDQAGLGWEAFASIHEQRPLSEVFENSEAGVLIEVLETAVKLNLPVNYECRLKTDTSEKCWVALLLSLDNRADHPVMNGIVISTMDRRLLEQEFLEEKLFAEQVLECSGVIFSVRNSETKLVRTNKAYNDVGGYTPEEIYFSDGDKHLIGESYEDVMCQFRQVLEGHYPLVSENVWNCKDGSKRTLRWTHTGLGSAGGQVDFIISVAVDITDLRTLENRLKGKIGEFEALFENSLVGIALVKNDRIVKANQICAEILGYTTSGINGLDMMRLFADRAAFGKFKEDIFPRISLGLRHFDYAFRKKDGKYGEFRISASPIANGTSDDGIIIVIDDVSEIKMVERALLRSETRFRTIFDKMASGLALINEAGYFEDVNDSWCRITGYSREEARKFRVIDITYDEDKAPSLNAIKGFLADTVDMERMEKRYIRKDGSQIWVDLTASKIDTRAESGEITLVSIINDITQRKDIEAKLKEINHHLETEKNRAQILADHRMALIELFDTFRNSQSVEDLQGILKNNLPQFVKYRDLLVALRISRSNPGYVIRDLLDETPENDILELIQNGRGIIGSVIQSNQIYVSNDVSTDPLFVSHHPECKSYLALPIVYKDFQWGVIGLDYFEAGHFTDQDIEILKMVGTLIAMQMEEMTAKLALHQESDRLRMLHDLVQEMAQARNNDDILKRICSSGLFAAVHIYTVGVCDGFNPCICALCEGQESMLPAQILDMKDVHHIFWESAEESYRFNLAISIRYNQELLGVLRVCSELPYTDQEIELASILAEQTGVFWELNNLIAQREREAMIDPLTAVWNRRYMIDRLEQEDERIFRYGGKACVAILDMGEFKLINDQYGHVKGDEVLVAAAGFIEKSVRKTDFVGRFGGDEFIVFLPNTGIHEAEKILAKIGDGIALLTFEGINRSIKIDSGVAVVPGDDSTLMGAVRTADERMYLNKRERKRSTLTTV